MHASDSSPVAPGSSFREWLRRFPKTETHLHIEGAVPYALLHAWRPDEFPEDPPFQRPEHRFASFADFDRVLLRHALAWFTNVDRYHEAAKALFARRFAESVRYLETSFHLPMCGALGVPGPVIIDAIRSAAPPGMEVRVFAGMLRTDYAGSLRPVIDDLENWDTLAGVDLHGDEAVPTQPWTATVWQRLRSAGKMTKAHAGEFDGAARVREAIEVLGVTRVAHGVRAIEDPAVVALARDRGVTFDVCPISNLRLRVVPGWREHPLPALIRAGVRCTVSTDDPLVFGNTLTDEYEGLFREARLTTDELIRCLKAGWEVALIPEQDRRERLDAIDQGVASAPAPVLESAGLVSVPS
jgi:adenosine deaminase